MTREIPVTQARDELADLVNRVAYGDERIVLTRHGRPVAALVSPSDLAGLEQADSDRQDQTRQHQSVTLTEAGQRAGPTQLRPVSPAEPLRIAAEHSPPGPGTTLSPDATPPGAPSSPGTPPA